MAVEAKRGCGYRKVGGLYLVSGRMAASCCKLPIPLTICPCCGAGIKQTRGWTWVNPELLINAGGCLENRGGACPAANPALLGQRCGLLWIGRAFYKSVDDFSTEAAALGISRRLTAVPRGFEVGKTWVLLAHPEAVSSDQGKGAGIFRMFLPERIELIVKQSAFDVVARIHAQKGHVVEISPAELMVVDRFNADLKRGVTWVPVPDDDPDHQGSVYDDKEVIDPPVTTVQGVPPLEETQL